APPHDQLLRLHAIKRGQCLAQRRRLRIGITAAAGVGIGRIAPGRFVGIEPDLAIELRAARRAVSGEIAQVLAHQREHVACCPVHPASGESALSNRRRTALACASSPSASASVTAQGPIAPIPAALADCTLTRFWKLATETPLQARAAPPVGSTWLVPLQ